MSGKGSPARPWMRALAVLLFLLGAGLFGRFVSRASWPELSAAVAALQPTTLALAVLFTIVSYLVLAAYDGLALHLVSARLRARKVLLTSFVSYAISHNLGMTLLSGGSNRLRMYSALGLTLKQISAVVVFCSFNFWVGFLFLTAVLHLAWPLAVREGLLFDWASTRPIGGLCAAVYLGFAGLALARSQLPERLRQLLPSGRFLLLQTLVATLDWCLAAAVLYVLIGGEATLPYSQFLAVFLLSQVLGMASNLPAGMGVFEYTMQALLPVQIAAPDLVAALLVYRVVYYLLPLGFALLLLLGQSLQRRPTAPRKSDPPRPLRS